MMTVGAWKTVPELVSTLKVPSVARRIDSTFSIRMSAPKASACSVMFAARSRPRMLRKPG